MVDFEEDFEAFEFDDHEDGELNFEDDDDIIELDALEDEEHDDEEGFDE